MLLGGYGTERISNAAEIAQGDSWAKGREVIYDRPKRSVEQSAKIFFVS
jgi:hypothetical protein